MPRRSDPYQRLRLRAWDQAAGLAAGGMPTADIPDAVSSALGADIDAITSVVVPRHGRSFWFSFAKSAAWGMAVVLLLLGFGPSGGSLPLLRPLLVVVVLVWAVTFGIFAANHKVRVDRAGAAVTARAVVGRTASRAVAGAAGDRGWSDRLRVRPGEVDGFVTDGSLDAVRRVLSAERPAVLFVRPPGVFTDPARAAAERCGIALFVLDDRDLVPMSGLASAALRADQPRAVLRGGWDAAAGPREAERPRRKGSG